MFGLLVYSNSVRPLFLLLNEMRRYSATVFGLLILAIAPSTSLIAQNVGVSDTTSTPIAGVPHDYLGDMSEIVNPANGALSIRVKAPVPHERGVNWPAYAFTWESNNNYNLSPTWQDGIAGNTSFSSLVLGPAIDLYSNFGSSQTRSVQLETGGGDTPTYTTYNCDISSGFVYTDPNGGNHAMGLQYNRDTDSGVSNYDCSKFNLGSTWTTGGDELYKAQMNTASWPPAVTVYDNHGNTLLTSNSTNGPSSVGNPTFAWSQGREDTNGNYLNTTGRTWSLTASSITLPGSSVPWTFSKTTGQASQLNFTVPVTSVGSTSGGNYCQVNSVSFTSSGSTIPPASYAVTLPNSLPYTFDYSQNSYGLIDKITYPTGATVSYTWALIDDMQGVLYTDKHGTGSGGICALRYGWYAVTKRVVNYNGQDVQEQDFDYSTAWPATGDTFNSYVWTSKTTTVTTKDLIRGTSFLTIYTYSPMAPPQTTDYSGYWGSPSPIPVESSIKYEDTTGSTLKTIKKVWQSPSLMSAECESLPNGVTSGKFYQYAAGGAGGVNPNASMTNLPTDVKEYDYGQVSGTGCTAPGTSVKPVRETTTQYASFTCPSSLPDCPAPQMLDRPTSIKIYGYGSLLAETDYQYDQWSLTSVSSAYGQDANYGPTAGYSSTSTSYFSSASGTGLLPRGNATTVTKKCFVGATACTDSVTKYQYDTTGQVVAVMDPCGSSTCGDVIGSGHTTTYVYADQYGGDGTAPSGYTTNAYVTQVTEPATSTTHVSNFTYGFNDGKLWTITDENSNVSHFYYKTNGQSGTVYDPFYRLTEVDHPDGGKELLSYSDSGPQPSVLANTLENSSSVYVINETVYDAYGHPTQTQLQSDSISTVYADTTYDGLGRVFTQSNPHRSAVSQTDGVTTLYYDSLGRKIVTEEPDGSIQQSCYDGVVSYPAVSNCTSAPLGSASSASWVDTSDEAQNRWQHVSDALGRLTRVFEPNGTVQSPSMETDYSYDGLGNLLAVSQNGVAGTDTARIRSFTYDSLSRLLTTKNPEVGTTAIPATSYTYDVSGNVVMKVSPAVNIPASSATSSSTTTISYCYDTLNRLRYKSYSASLNCASPSSFASAYAYDGTVLTGSVINPPAFTYAKGHLTDQQEFVGATLVAERQFTTFDTMGRLRKDAQNPYASVASSYTMITGYDYMGHVTQFDNGVSSTSSPSIPALIWNTSYNGAGQLNTLTVNSQPSSWTGSAYPVNLLYGPTYDAFGHMVGAKMSSTSQSTSGQLQIARTYDNRGRINSEIDTGASQSSTATNSIGTIVVVGAEQAPVYPASAYAKATVTISGTERDNTFNACPGNPQGPCNTAIPDTGTVTIVVAGTTVSTTFALGSTSSSLALTLANGINNASLPVTASTSGSVISVKANTPGTAADTITISVGSTDTQQTYYGTTPSFSLTSSGGALTGGSNAGQTQYDSGTLSATINGHIATVSYSSASTPQSLASSLSSAIQTAVGSTLSVTTDGDVSVLISTSTGSATDYSVSTSNTYDTADFSQPSFVISAAGMQDGFAADSTNGLLYTYFVPSGAYTPNGNILFLSDSVVGDWEYQYDTLNRLTAASSLLGAYSGQHGCWTYDSFGSRKMEAYSTATSTPCAAGANDNVSLTTTTPTSKNQLNAFTYDAAGNVIQDSINKYVYDQEGRVCAVENLLTTSAFQYVYDASGVRVAKGSLSAWPTAGNSCNAPTAVNGFTLTAQYILDSAGNQVNELDGSGAWVHTNTWAGARVAATYDTKGLHFQLSDPLGTRRVQASALGALEESCKSLPFGNGQSCATTSLSTADDSTEHHFTGKERDVESGLDYFGARYYGSSMGRWMSPDLPFADQNPENPQSWNLYGYVRNNPLDSVDTNGRVTWLIGGTWHNPKDWTASSPLGQEMSGFFDPTDDDVETIEWSGGNSDGARAELSAKIAAAMAAHTWKPGEQNNIVCHSHGCNGVMGALPTLMTDGFFINNLVSLGQPMRGDYPYSGGVDTWYNVYAGNDLVQKLGGRVPLFGGRKNSSANNFQVHTGKNPISAHGALHNDWLTRMQWEMFIRNSQSGSSNGQQDEPAWVKWIKQHDH